MKFDQSHGKTLHTDGADIYYEMIGNTGGEPLLLLHGGLGSLRDLNDFVGDLPSRYTVIGMDFRGHGRSTLGKLPLTYEQHQKDVEAVLNRLGIDSTSILGFSDGGIVGYRMAAQSHIKINRLITLGARWRLLPEDPSLPLLAGMTADAWSGMFPESVDYYREINPNPDFDGLVKAVVGLWTDMRSTGHPNESVQRIQSPTLIVRGDNDELLSLEEAAVLRKKITTSALLNIPFSGHAAHLESPAIFLASVKDFLLRPSN